MGPRIGVCQGYAEGPSEGAEKRILQKCSPVFG